MRLILLALAALTAFAGAASAQVQTPGAAANSPVRDALRTWRDPDLGLAVVEGAATDASLWLRGVSGALVHFDRTTGERTVVAADVVDILADGPHLWALIALNENEGVVRDIRQPRGTDRKLYFEGALIGLIGTPEGPDVLTDSRILRPDGARWSRTRLAGGLEPHAHISPLTAGSVFVGYNRGEWGGGLRRADVATGSLAFVQEADAEVCRGRLDPACAPIVGVIADPQADGCVLVGTSLAHMSSRKGEVLRVCGNEITPVFSDPLPVVEGDFMFRPGQTWPFDSLVAVNDGWIAVGHDGYARSRQGVVTMASVPALASWSGLSLSDPVDGVIFIQAACCWGSAHRVLGRVIAVPISD